MSEPQSDDQRLPRHAHGSRHDRGIFTLAGRVCGGELAPGEALTLRVRRAGQLHVRGERLWLTFGPTAAQSHVRGGDHFVEPGQHLALRPQEAVVIGPCAPSGQVCRRAGFQWRPAISPLGALRQSLANALHALAARIARPSLRAQT